MMSNKYIGAGIGAEQLNLKKFLKELFFVIPGNENVRTQIINDIRNAAQTLNYADSLDAGLNPAKFNENTNSFESVYIGILPMFAEYMKTSGGRLATLGGDTYTLADIPDVTNFVDHFMNPPEEFADKVPAGDIIYELIKEIGLEVDNGMRDLIVPGLKNTIKLLPDPTPGPINRGTDPLTILEPNLANNIVPNDPSGRLHISSFKSNVPIHNEAEYRLFYSNSHGIYDLYWETMSNWFMYGEDGESKRNTKSNKALDFTTRVGWSVRHYIGLPTTRDTFSISTEMDGDTPVNTWQSPLLFKLNKPINVDDIVISWTRDVWKTKELEPYLNKKITYVLHKIGDNELQLDVYDSIGVLLASDVLSIEGLPFYSMMVDESTIILNTRYGNTINVYAVTCNISLYGDVIEPKPLTERYGFGVGSIESITSMTEDVDNRVLAFIPHIETNDMLSTLSNALNKCHVVITETNIKLQSLDNSDNNVGGCAYLGEGDFELVDLPSSINKWMSYGYIHILTRLKSNSQYHVVTLKTKYSEIFECMEPTPLDLYDESDGDTIIVQDPHDPITNNVYIDKPHLDLLNIDNGNRKLAHPTIYNKFTGCDLNASELNLVQLCVHGLRPSNNLASLKLYEEVCTTVKALVEQESPVGSDVSGLRLHLNK